MANLDYDTLIEKLAGEIIDTAIMEKEAELDQQESLEKEAALNAKTVKKAVKKAHLADKVEAVKDWASKNKAALAAGAGAGAAGGAAGYAMGKSASEYTEEEMEVLAAEQQTMVVVEKAANVFEDAQYMKEAALEILAEAELYEDAVAEIFKQAGLLDEEDFEDVVEEE